MRVILTIVCMVYCRNQRNRQRNKDHMGSYRYRVFKHFYNILIFRKVAHHVFPINFDQLFLARLFLNKNIVLKLIKCQKKGSVKIGNLIILEFLAIKGKKIIISKVLLLGFLYFFFVNNIFFQFGHSKLQENRTKNAVPPHILREKNHLSKFIYSPKT